MTVDQGFQIIALLRLIWGKFDQIVIELQNVNDTLSNVLTEVSAIAENTSSIEALISSSIAILNSISSGVTTSNSLLNQVISDLNTAILELQALTTNTDTIEAKLQAIITQLTAFNNNFVNIMTSLIKYEDTQSSNGDAGVQLLTLRQSTLSTTSSDELDYQPLKTDSLGRLHVLSSSINEVMRYEELPDTPSVGTKTIYIGYGLPGSTDNSNNWRIERLIDSGTTKSLNYADGVSNYSKNWTLRGSYTYS